MNKFAVALVSLPLLAFSGAALAGDAAAGKVKADACMDCHAGEDFEGMDAAAIEAAIRAALAGEVKHGPEIKDLAEADIADVAAFFAAEAGN
jgi:cytochrome c553